MAQRHFLLLALLAGQACASAPAARAPTPVPAGCYRFDSAYFPVIGRHSQTGVLLSLHTRELALLREAPPRDVVRGPQAPHAVRPIPFEVDTLTRRRWEARSGWTPLGPDSIRLAWHNGLFGPAFRLAVRGDSLRGTVVHTTDVAGPPPPVGMASATRIPCPGPGSAGSGSGAERRLTSR